MKPEVEGTASFKYDPFGRYIYKSSSAGTSVFAYDGDNLVEETNSTGTAVACHSQGLNIDEPIAILRSGTTSYYITRLFVAPAHRSGKSLRKSIALHLFPEFLAQTGFEKKCRLLLDLFKLLIVVAGANYDCPA